jgi:hypothetical protein
MEGRTRRPELKVPVGQCEFDMDHHPACLRDGEKRCAGHVLIELCGAGRVDKDDERGDGAGSARNTVAGVAPVGGGSSYA